MTYEPAPQDERPVQVMDDVATEPSLAGVPEVVVQYESCPMVSLVLVETELARALSEVWRGMT